MAREPELTWILNKVVSDLHREGVVAITTAGMCLRCYGYIYTSVPAGKLSAYGRRHCPRPLKTMGTVIWVEYGAGIWSWTKMSKREGEKALKDFKRARCQAR